MSLNYRPPGVYSSEYRETSHFEDAQEVDRLRREVDRLYMETSHFEDAKEVDRLKRKIDDLYKTISSLKRELKAKDHSKDYLDDLRLSVLNFNVSV